MVRALLVGLALLPLNAYWAAAVVSDIMFSLLVPPLGSLMVLTLLNLLLRRAGRTWAFTDGELVIIYVFLSVGTAMSADWMLINNQYVHSYALFSERNPWDREHIVPLLPDWFYFTNPAPLEDYRRGGYGFAHFLTRLGLWMKPVVAWTALLGLLGAAMLCVNTLMRDQWCRREKLAFPIIQVPLLLTRPDSPAWKSPYLWGAFGVMFFIDILNGIGFLYPGFPTLNVRFLGGRLMDWLPWMADPPWTPIGWTIVGIFPYMSAIAAFMPTDLLFSWVFFFFVRKGTQFILAMHGYEQGVFGGGWLVPSPPYFSEQTWGAIFGLFVGALISSRSYLRELWGHIRQNTALVPDELSPRRAFAGLILSLAGLAAIGMACRLPPWLVVGYVAVFLIFSAVITRMRAQLGPPLHEMAFVGPHQLIQGFAGGQPLPESTTVRLYHLFFVTNRLHRSHPMPYQLEGYKIGEGSGVSPRALFWVMLGAAVLGIAVGQLAYAYRGYERGAVRPWGDPSAAIRQMYEQPSSPNPAAMLAVIGGFSVVMLLDALRFRMPGFPLHPVGYALSMNYGVDAFWFGLILVLMLKVLVHRYTGLRGYERFRLAAMGVILAEYAAELIWSSVYMAMDITTYSISIYARAGWLR